MTHDPVARLGSGSVDVPLSFPADNEIIALHDKHAPTGEALESVYAHCEIVWRIAEQLLGRGFPGAAVVDAGLVPGRLPAARHRGVPAL